MPTKNSTARIPQPQTNDQELTFQEVAKLVRRVCAELDSGSEEIALLILLMDHVGSYVTEPLALALISDIKGLLFFHTGEATDAQEAFRRDAFRNRGKLLRFSRERKGAS